MRRIGSLLAFALFLLRAPCAQAEGVFINAPDRADILYDDAHDLLYITSDTQVLRYQVQAGTFLPPITLGGQLKGMDLSPDGSTLAVADFSFDSVNEKNWIHLVDLSTLSDRKVKFDLEFLEGGTVCVAYGADGKLLITSQYQGSGPTPLRLYDPAKGKASTIGNVLVTAIMAPSGNRKVIGIANIGDNNFGRYRLKGKDLNQTGGTPADNFAIGVNKTANLYAVSSNFGTVIADKNLNKIGDTIGEDFNSEPLASAFHPTKRLVYFPWTGTTLVKVYSTTTWTQVDSFDFETTFMTPGGYFTYRLGRTILSKDGKLLFVTVGNGVRYVHTKHH